MKKILTITMVMLLVALSIVPAFAGTAYTPVAGTSCTFNTYLIMDGTDTVPNATFSYTVAPGQAISADTNDNSVMQVLPGVGTPTIADVVFAPTDTTADAAGTNIDVARTQEDRTGTAGGDTVQFGENEKYATKVATVNFTGITFDEPGIYRYIITQTANETNEAAGIVHDTDVDRVLDVYVTDDGTGTLVVSSYVIHTSVSNVDINGTMGSADVASAGAALDDKTDGFTNEFVALDLAVGLNVTGNQASRDKYFAVTVTMTNINADDSYVVSGAYDATSGTTAATKAAYRGQTNSSVVSGSALLAGKTFYLQHGQNIVIHGIAPNAKYTIAENAEDYSGASMLGAVNTSGENTIAAVSLESFEGAKVVRTGFVNTRDGVIPTGVMISVSGGVTLVAIALIALFVLGRKKSEDEE